MRTLRSTDLVTKRLRGRDEIIALSAILLLAAVLNLSSLGQNGYGNTYYAASVKSMLLSRHNFFYASFDPAGFVNIDKPPLGLWIQAIFARVLGFRGLSLALPQAISGIVSVALLYALVRRTSGPVAALIAGMLLAISPVNVVANRSNILESLLTTVLLLAAVAFVRAIERKSLGWLLLGSSLLGAGFNIKGLEAWLVVPVLAVTYLTGVSFPWRIRLRNLAFALLLMSFISMSWLVMVDLTPAARRPYVGSTFTNSEVDLMFNYNGLQRLLGEPNYGGPPRASKHLTGDVGPLRLFESPLGGQVSWFLPWALLGMVAMIANAGQFSLRTSWRVGDLTLPQRALVLWGGWLLTVGAFFSIANRFNLYYLAVLAPAVCALAGIGTIALWRDMRVMGWRGWLYPLAFGTTGFVQIHILRGYPTWDSWQVPLLTAAVVVGLILLITFRLISSLLGRLASTRTLKILAAAVYVTLLFVPLRWLSVSLSADNGGEFPTSGPTPLAQGNFRVLAPDPQLLAYLAAHSSHDRFAVGTSSIEDAAAIILATDKAAMPMGGFSGYDPILTSQMLASRVTNGDVHVFLVPVSNLTVNQARTLYGQDIAYSGGAFVTQHDNQITAWISDRCIPLAPEEWQTVPQLEEMQLYDCAP